MRFRDRFLFFSAGEFGGGDRSGAFSGLLEGRERRGGGGVLVRERVRLPDERAGDFAGSFDGARLFLWLEERRLLPSLDRLDPRDLSESDPSEPDPEREPELDELDRLRVSCPR